MQIIIDVCVSDESIIHLMNDNFWLIVGKDELLANYATNYLIDRSDVINI